MDTLDDKLQKWGSYCKELHEKGEALLRKHDRGYMGCEHLNVMAIAEMKGANVNVVEASSPEELVEKVAAIECDCPEHRRGRMNVVPGTPEVH